jgi:aspartyl-tRNA(Asn)/glutamyl-tRNA(Gln) amidotransferase subunit A
MTEDLAFLSAAEAGRRIAAGQLSPVALVQHMLERIGRLNDRLQIYITVAAEAALEAARQAEAEIAAGQWRGPLHGVPFAVKDNYNTAGLRTTAGSRLMLDVVPEHSAAAILRLQQAGAILLGKLNTWEYGTGNAGVYFDLPFPPARNPWNTYCFTGGSSTGAGAAVVAGLASFALGSDTGGSIRLPAAACGVLGLKPSYGRVSRAGMLPNCWSLDVAGPLCRDAADAALVLGVLAGADPMDEATSALPVPDYGASLGQGVRGLTIGLIATAPGEEPGPDQAAALAEAAAALQAAGAVLRPVALPAPLASYRSASGIINQSESFSIHEQDSLQRGHLMGRALREKMMAGATVRAADYLAAQRQRRVLAAGIEQLFDAVDALLLPGTQGVAPPFADHDAVVAFTRRSWMAPFSVSGHPALTAPAGHDAAGMPRNIQLATRWFDEATLLRCAAALEAAAPWPVRHPDLHFEDIPA